MVKELMQEPSFLSFPSVEATAADLPVAADLLDTLLANKETCVGMAANMIGERKRIIAFLDESGKTPVYTVMYNPQIIGREGGYETKEGCLSLLGDPRPCKRYRKIKVRYQNEKMQTRVKNYGDFTAQIIQHEIDHCNGILI